ncbi:hypothetical protein [Lysinibacillus xylanilyticus]|uniref:hypothetical protein n=1 Tax=Lysinibacillus xylanilyticus TaxID=582475 RepID=UPI003802E4C8
MEEYSRNAERYLTEGKRILAESRRKYAEGKRILVEGRGIPAKGKRILAEGNKYPLEAEIPVKIEHSSGRRDVSRS